MPRIYEPGLESPVYKPIVIQDTPSSPSGGYRPGPAFNAPAASGPAPTAAPLIDYSGYLGMFGLPADVQKQINQIFATTADAGQALLLAQAYVRGTDWYKATYPGISEAISKGLVNNEADYRQLLNQQSQIYKQYMGRDITADEFANNLRAGLSNQTISGRLQGNALASTYGNDWRYALGNFGEGQPTQDELNAVGQEKAGLDTPLGQLFTRRLTMAQQRLQNVFSGSLATPGVGLSSLGQLGASGFGSKANQQFGADVAA